MNNHVVIIAEAGVNHNGSLDLARKMVDVAKDCDDVLVGVGSFVRKSILKSGVYSGNPAILKIKKD